MDMFSIYQPTITPFDFVIQSFSTQMQNASLTIIKAHVSLRKSVGPNNMISRFWTKLGPKSVSLQIVSKSELTCLRVCVEIRLGGRVMKTQFIELILSGPPPSPRNHCGITRALPRPNISTTHLIKVFVQCYPALVGWHCLSTVDEQSAAVSDEQFPLVDPYLPLLEF